MFAAVGLRFGRWLINLSFAADNRVVLRTMQEQHGAWHLHVVREMVIVLYPCLYSIIMTD